MRGLMQDWPLLLHRIIDHAARHHPNRDVVTRSVQSPDGILHRTTYADIRARALRGAQRLCRDGIMLGDRIATLAWTTSQHLEAWYAITGMGAVCHTVNPRLAPEQIAWILNHAGTRMVFVDEAFLPLLERIVPSLPFVERVVVFANAVPGLTQSLPKAIAYEDWLAEADGDFSWPQFDESTAAGLCYTSGTTGEPKGVLFSHRSNMLLALGVNGADAYALTARDRVLAVVPMFHANGWVLPYAAPLAGASLILPGAALDGASLHSLAEQEHATFAAAVPVLWTGLLRHLDETGGQLSTLKRVCVGGSACPRELIRAYQERYGVRVQHAWGMTETSGGGVINFAKPEAVMLSPDISLVQEGRQGAAGAVLDFKIMDDDGRELAWDGKTAGRLMVRGPAVARAYFRSGGSSSPTDADGYLDTGDVAVVDPEGYIQITDRTKDLIKSGGEWISSVALETIACDHPDVAEAAAIAVPHPTWGERPLLLIVANRGTEPGKDDIIGHLIGKVTKWWLPDEVVLVDELPHTATGKVDKKVLRAKYHGRSKAEAFPE